METKQIMMLSILILIGIVGAAIIIRVLMKLDTEEDGSDKSGHH